MQDSFLGGGSCQLRLGVASLADLAGSCNSYSIALLLAQGHRIAAPAATHDRLPR